MIFRSEEVKTTDILPRKYNVDYVGITVMKVLNAHFFHSARHTVLAEPLLSLHGLYFSNDIFQLGEMKQYEFS